MRIYDPWFLLGAVAGATTRLKIGTAICIVPMNNPLILARHTATAHDVSGGRFLLGVGLGYRPEEFAIFGVPMAERVSRLAEGVEIIRRLWTEDKVTHRGRHWTFENLTIRPRPIQSPRPPILVGSQVPAGIARAARIADGWLVVPPGRIFAMGDNRDDSLDSRYWGFVPRENIVGTPVIIYWSFEAPTQDLTNPNIGIDHIVDVVAHFFTKTRWSRTFKLIRGYPLQ